VTRPAMAGRLALLALWAAAAVFVVWGAPRVPFHPDESSYLYMSRDFDRLLHEGPAAVTWQAAEQPADVLRYRLLDAPMTRYLVGLGRSLAGLPALPRDWNWSASWDDNARSGALPNPAQLANARLPAALLTALSLGLVYGIGDRLNGWAAGVLAALLFGLSGEALLHGRRGMAEGPLVFFGLLTIWVLLRRPKQQPELAGVGVALAVASKLTGLALAPVAVLALWVAPIDRQAAGRRPRLQSLLWLTVSFAAALFLLSPALWRAPVDGVRALARARQELLATQTAALRVATPGLVADSLGARAAGMLYQIYFAPLAFWDVPNYAAQTRAAELAYLAQPLHSGWPTPVFTTNLIVGGAIFGLTLAGIAFGALSLLRPGPALEPEQRYALYVIGAWTAATVIVLLSLNIIWQRYYLPLVPIVCVWAAYGATRLARPFTNRPAALQPLVPHS
jgi:4-amino-4-deoxy-L-arabinose transferase-like glycosyltransferase